DEIRLEDDIPRGVDVAERAQRGERLSGDGVADGSDDHEGRWGRPANQLVDAADLRFEEDLVRVVQLGSRVDSSERSARARSSGPRDLGERSRILEKVRRRVAVGEMHSDRGVARRIEVTVDVLVSAAAAVRADSAQDIVAETIDEDPAAHVGADPEQ